MRSCTVTTVRFGVKYIEEMPHNTRLDDMINLSRLAASLPWISDAERAKHMPQSPGVDHFGEIGDVSSFI